MISPDTKTTPLYDVALICQRWQGALGGRKAEVPGRRAWAAEDEDGGGDKRTQDKASGKEGHGRSEGASDEDDGEEEEGAAGPLEMGRYWWSWVVALTSTAPCPSPSC